MTKDEAMHMIAATGCYLDGCKCYVEKEECGVEVVRKKKWVGLTDDEIKKLSDDCAGVRDETEFIRTIEAKLKEKNETT